MDTPTLVESDQMTYFRTPGPPRAKLKGGPGYEAMHTVVWFKNSYFHGDLFWVL